MTKRYAEVAGVWKGGKFEKRVKYDPFGWVLELSSTPVEKDIRFG